MDIFTSLNNRTVTADKIFGWITTKQINQIESTTIKINDDINKLKAACNHHKHAACNHHVEIQVNVHHLVNHLIEISIFDWYHNTSAERALKYICSEICNTLVQSVLQINHSWKSNKSQYSFKSKLNHTECINRSL